MNGPGGRRLDAGLRLLDRQIIDRDGRMAGKVDDLELTLDEAGDGPPTVTAILTGPAAWAPRAGGIGRSLLSLLAVLRGPDRSAPTRIPFAAVKRLDDHIELVLADDELDNHEAEAWVRDHVISHIPGAGHAPD